MTTVRKLRALTAVLLLLAITVNGHPYTVSSYIRSTSDITFPSENNENKNDFPSPQLQQSYIPSTHIDSPKNDTVEQSPPILQFVTKTINKVKNKKKSAELELRTGFGIDTRLSYSVPSKESLRQFIGDMFRPIQKNIHQNPHGNPTPYSHSNNLQPQPIYYTTTQPPFLYNPNVMQPQLTYYSSTQPPSPFNPNHVQQNANGKAVAENKSPFVNQNAGADSYSSNVQNPHGQYQNTGGLSISSNLANNGQSGQLSAANTDQQSYYTVYGSGQKNAAQGQSANYDQYGNLQTSNSNSGTENLRGPNGDRQKAFGSSNANGKAVAENKSPFVNQNAGADSYSSNVQNPHGQYQNTGGSSISSNLANNGQSGQLSAANTDQQSYYTVYGSGQKNAAQGQSANYDQYGNLQTSNSIAGTENLRGPNGDRQKAFGSSNANEQNKYGSSNSGSQTNVEQFNENGVQGSKTSSSSFSNVLNNGNGDRTSSSTNTFTSTSSGSKPFDNHAMPLYQPFIPHGFE
ncbi:stress protein DDR48-like [Contarinia nasturtii]|uniref:stress protein DDR48-like n=1 Tax=Contarinia nasturtii TaxID=265458 RepID=UPI0012D45F29|nr:stress protein DDR48-like [Contarinia nasturtii]